MPVQSEIDEAVQSCARRCWVNHDLRACVRDFVNELVMAGGWAQPDAEEVGRAALAVIAQLRGKLSVIVDDVNAD